MWPWGHLAVGYLLYTLLSRTHCDRSPTGSATLAVIIGTQFPDLVDKPLAWSFDILAVGRSLAHSLVIASAVIALVRIGAARRDRPLLALAFGVGYLSHLATDAIQPLIQGEYTALAYLGWPLTHPPIDGEELGFIGHFMTMTVTPLFILQFVLVGVAVVVWWYDEAPGLNSIRRWTMSNAQSTE